MPIAASGMQTLTFKVGREALALPLGEVREVIRTPVMTRVPLSAPSLLGLANLRGTVIPIVSLGTLLHADGTGSAERVVIVDRGAPVGVAVDEVRSLTADAESEARLLDLDEVLNVEFGLAGRSAAASLASSAVTVEMDAVDTRDPFLSFDIAGQEFAFPLESVKEVMPLPHRVTAMPHTDGAMLGVITVRNRLLPLLSLRHLLGFGAGGEDLNARIVVAEMAGIEVGVVVDAARDIFRAAPEDRDPVPPVLTRGRQEAEIQAICRLDGGKRLVSILSTDRLLDEDLVARLAAETGEEGGEVGEQQQADETEQFLVFKIGEESFGLPLATVEEVAAFPERITKVPKTPSFIEGAINLRGRAVPVIDQAARLGTRANKASARRRIVILRMGDGLTGLAVDGSTGLLRIQAARISPAPELARARSSVINRVANLDDEGRMVLIIDPAELLDEAEQELVAAIGQDMPGGS